MFLLDLIPRICRHCVGMNVLTSMPATDMLVLCDSGKHDSDVVQFAAVN